MKKTKENYSNIFIPAEMVVVEKGNCFGIQYRAKTENHITGEIEYEWVIIFIPNKFKLKVREYTYKVGLIKNWTYIGYTKEGKQINVPAGSLIFYLLNERNKYTEGVKNDKSK